MNICMFDKEDFLRINESDSDIFSMLTQQTNVMHVQVLQDIDFLQMLIYKVTANSKATKHSKNAFNFWLIEYNNSII